MQEKITKKEGIKEEILISNNKTSDEKHPGGSIKRSKVLGLFLLGFAIGVAVKAEAVKTITIGFNDYQLEELRDDFQVNKKEAVKSPADSSEKEEAAPSQQPSSGDQ